MLATFCTIVKGKITSPTCLGTVSKPIDKSVMNYNIYTIRQKKRI